MTPGRDLTRPLRVGDPRTVLVGGMVASGPPHLVGRRLDDILPSPPMRPEGQTGYPIVQQGAGGQTFWCIPNSPGGPVRFLLPATAATVQHYLDAGGDTYRWIEDELNRRLVIQQNLAGFSAGGNADVYASGPATTDGRLVMESGYRSLLKGELIGLSGIADPRLHGELQPLARSMQVRGNVPPISQTRPIPTASPSRTLTSIPNIGQGIQATLEDQNP